MKRNKKELTEQDKLFYKRRLISLVSKGETQKEMAERIQEPKMFAMGVFRGIRRSLRVEKKIAAYLGGDLEYFFDCSSVVRKKRSLL